MPLISSVQCIYACFPAVIELKYFNVFINEMSQRSCEYSRIPFSFKVGFKITVFFRHRGLSNISSVREQEYGDEKSNYKKRCIDHLFWKFVRNRNKRIS